MLPNQMKEKMIKQLKDFIDDGNVLLGRMRGRFPSGLYCVSENINTTAAKFVSDSAIIMAQLLQKDSPQLVRCENYIRTDGPGDQDVIEYCLGVLLSLRDGLQNDYLGSLPLRIESEISCDYMDQAKQLMEEGKVGNYDHVPAAVLAGAVLEKSIRTLCEKRNPPINIKDGEGRNFQLNRLIDEIKKLEKPRIINEAKAKELKGYADIRNHAAHGEFDQFDRGQVERMIQGVEDFLANFLC